MTGMTFASQKSLQSSVAIALTLVLVTCAGCPGGGGGGGGNPGGWTVTWSAPGQAITEWEHVQVVKNTNDRLKSVPAPTGGTGNAFMFTVLNQDQFAVGDKCQTIGGGWRAEGIGPHEQPSNKIIRYEWNTRFENGFPVNPVDASGNSVWVLFTQWHQKDPTGTNPAIGSSPPIEFIIEKGMLKLRLNRASQPGPSTEFATVDLTPVNPGTWHHWAAEIQWSPTDGSVKVWHDGMIKYDSTNPKVPVQTIFPDPDSPGQPGDSYLKVGLYRKPINAPGLWVVLHDEFKRLEQGNASPLPHPSGTLPTCIS